VKTSVVVRVSQLWPPGDEGVNVTVVVNVK
jgi:hypothetical protein